MRKHADWLLIAIFVVLAIVFVSLKWYLERPQ